MQRVRHDLVTEQQMCIKLIVWVLAKQLCTDYLPISRSSPFYGILKMFNSANERFSHLTNVKND